MSLHVGVGRGPGHLDRFTGPSGPAIPVIPAIPAALIAHGGTNFGQENTLYPYSGAVAANATQATIAQAVLGAAYHRTLQLTPSVPIPTQASGLDHWMAFFVRMGADALDTVRTQYMLGVSGNAQNGGSGGTLQIPALKLVSTNGSGNGQTFPLAATAGVPKAFRKRANNWNPFNNEVWATNFVAGRTYFVAIGVINNGSFDTGRITICDIAAGTVAHFDGTLQVVARQVATYPLFDQVGTAGLAVSASDWQGFGGSVQDVFVVSGTYPSDALCLQFALGQASVFDINSLNGAALQAHNTLDWSTQSAGTIPGTATNPSTSAALPVTMTAVLTGTNPLSSAALRSNGTATLDQLAPYWVFPIIPGASTGTVWFEGACNIVGSTVNCRCVAIDASQTSAWFPATVTAGRFRGSVTGWPKGKPFYREIRVGSEATTLVRDWDPMDVGVVIAVMNHQSEFARCIQSAYAMASTGVDSGPSGHVVPSAPPTGCWASLAGTYDRTTTGVSSAVAKNLLPLVALMRGNGDPGDSIMVACNRVMADMGCSVMLSTFGRGGTPNDAWAYDRVSLTRLSTDPTPLTLAGAGSGGSPYTATLTTLATDFQRKFSNVSLTTTSYTTTAIFGITPGSFVLTLSDGSIITDPNTADTGQATGALSSTGAPAGFAGTVNYQTGAISFSYTSPPVVTVTSIAWKTKNELGDNTGTTKTLAVWDGWSVNDNFDMIAAYAGRYGWTFGYDYQATTNLSTDGTSTSLWRDSWGAKEAIIRARLLASIHSDVDPALNANLPVLFGRKGRATDQANGAVTGQVVSGDRARRAIDLLPNVYSWAKAGSQYYDIETDIASSPHPSVAGAVRYGRWFGADWSSMASNTPSLRTGPKATSQSIATNIINVQFDQAVGVNTGGSTAALSEWYVVTSGTAAYDANGFQTTTATVVDNAAFATARIKAGDATVVEIVKASGNWVGSEVAIYMLGNPGPVQTTPPVSLLYGQTGGFGGDVPGLLAQPKSL